ncbi:protein disulfide isomerase family, partial [Trichomonas vaginalis G3]
MFYLFLQASICEIPYLTLAEADRLLTEEKHKPVLISLESVWCSRCNEYKNVQAKLDSFFEDNDKIIMKKISCEKEPVLCKKFQGEGVPRVYMATTTAEKSRLYNESRTYEELKSFIRKYIEPPVIQIEDEEQLQSELEINQNLSLFFLQDLQRTSYSELFLEFATKYDEYPARFYNFSYKHYNTDKPLLYYQFPLLNQTLEYNQAWEAKEVERFIYAHLYPKYCNPSSLFFKIQKDLHEPFIILEDYYKKHTLDVFNITLQLPDGMKIADTDCLEMETYCRSIGVNPARRPFFAIHNNYLDIWYDFLDNYDKDKVIEWAIKVWNGKISGSGPG